MRNTTRPKPGHTEAQSAKAHNTAAPNQRRRSPPEPALSSSAPALRGLPLPPASTPSPTAPATSSNLLSAHDTPPSSSASTAPGNSSQFWPPPVRNPKPWKEFAAPQDLWRCISLSNSGNTSSSTSPFPPDFPLAFVFYSARARGS
jgi:hypothetical protein